MEIREPREWNKTMKFALQFQQFTFKGKYPQRTRIFNSNNSKIGVLCRNVSGAQCATLSLLVYCDYNEWFVHNIVFVMLKITIQNKSEKQMQYKKKTNWFFVVSVCAAQRAQQKRQRKPSNAQAFPFQSFCFLLFQIRMALSLSVSLHFYFRSHIF